MAIKKEIKVLAGVKREGNTSLYYSDQLSELRTIESERTALVVSVFTDNIIVVQEFTVNYDSQLSEAEIFVEGETTDDVINEVVENLFYK